MSNPENHTEDYNELIEIAHLLLDVKENYESSVFSLKIKFSHKTLYNMLCYRLQYAGLHHRLNMVLNKIPPWI